MIPHSRARRRVRSTPPPPPAASVSLVLFLLVLCIPFLLPPMLPSMPTFSSTEAVSPPILASLALPPSTASASAVPVVNSTRRVFLVLPLRSLSDAFAAQATLLLSPADGYILVQPTSTARGLLLSPLSLDHLLASSGTGAPSLPGCSGLCAHLPLPPQPVHILGAAAAAAWRRWATLQVLQGWVTQAAPPSPPPPVPWWPLLPTDVLLHLPHPAAPHPQALRALADPATPLPATLRTGPLFLYHLGLAAPAWGRVTEAEEEGNSSSPGSPGGTALLAAQAGALAGQSPDSSPPPLPPPSITPGTAALRLFGGLRALQALRLAHPPDSPLWHADITHAAAAALSPTLLAAVLRGQDLGPSALTALPSAQVPQAQGYLGLFRAAALPAAQAHLQACLGGPTAASPASCSCTASLPPSAQAAAAHSGSSLLLSCLSGRLGNYAVNLLNSLALARVSGRLPVLQPMEPPSFSHYFQLHRQPWGMVEGSSPLATLAAAAEAAAAAAAPPLPPPPPLHTLCLSTVAKSTCGERPVEEWAWQLGGGCSTSLGVGEQSPPPYSSPMLALLGIGEAEVLTPATHPTGVRGRAYPSAVLTPTPHTLVLQAFNYYDYDYSGPEEWLDVRCSLDFSQRLLGAAAAFTGPAGPLRGQPYFSLHARLEDFSYSFPGADTAPPLADFVAYAAALAHARGLVQVFVASNGTPLEVAAILAQLQGAGLTGHVHPDRDSDDGKYLDAAIAGSAAAFLGNKISTYSHLIAGQMLCAGRGKDATFFRAALAAQAAQKKE